MEDENQKSMRILQLLQSFSTIQNTLMGLIQKSLVKYGLTFTQYLILITIVQYEEMAQKKLVETTFLPKSTISQAVNGLVEKNLLDRNIAEGNRREIQLKLNEKGKTILKEIHFQKHGIYEVLEIAIGSLSDNQYKNLLETHLQLLSHMEKNRD